MSFSKGQMINVLDKNDPDWWKGELNGATGLFPTNYVRLTTADFDPSQQGKLIFQMSYYGCSCKKICMFKKGGDCVFVCNK